MNINTTILCMTGTIVLIDFVAGLVSSIYRERSGQYIGALAYIVLLANLSYVAYHAEADMIVFRDFFVMSQLVGAVFVIGYAINIYRSIRWIQNNRTNGILYAVLKNDFVSRCQENEKLISDNERLSASLQHYTEKERIAMEKHNLRVIANEEYEDTLTEETAMKETREAFQLYALLISKYAMERGPKFELQLHNVCERICSQLSAEDLRALMQIDSELTREAGEYYDATNVFHRNNKDV